MTRVWTAVVHGIALALVASASQAQPRAAAKAVKEVTLTAQVTQIQLASGQTVPAWGYNGQVPGPEIRVKEGERVRIVFKNELPVPTSVHWHGVDVPWTMDGPPGINQKPVAPGETFVYEFVAKPAGTRFYHTHGSGQRDEATQMDMGLYGAFIIEGRKEPKYDRDYTVILSERAAALMAGPPQAAAGGHAMMSSAAQAPAPGTAAEGAHAAGDAFFMNGQSWPATAPLKVKKGERVRIRLINAGSMSIHPMHLHGHSFRIVAIDGHRLAAPIRRDVVPLTAGERYDIEFVADNPGVWLFHCHELHHMDAGMAVLVQYDGFEPVDKAAPAPAPGAAGPGAGH